MSVRTVDILNQLLVLHSRSLPSYLTNAPPWAESDDSKAIEVLQNIADDHAYMVNRIAMTINANDGTVAMGEYPMTFTDLHDLSTDYILRQVVNHQHQDIETISELISQLDGDPEAKAIAEEALGAAQGHLENLEELLVQPSGLAK